jgi:hypothetical protein
MAPLWGRLETVQFNLLSAAIVLRKWQRTIKTRAMGTQSRVLCGTGAARSRASFGGARILTHPIFTFNIYKKKNRMKQSSMFIVHIDFEIK